MFCIATNNLCPYLMHTQVVFEIKMISLKHCIFSIHSFFLHISVSGHQYFIFLIRKKKWDAFLKMLCLSSLALWKIFTFSSWDKLHYLQRLMFIKAELTNLKASSPPPLLLLVQPYTTRKLHVICQTFIYHPRRDIKRRSLVLHL